MKLKSIIDTFEKNLKKEGKSNSTITAYTKDIEQLAEYLKDKTISTITQKDLQSFIDYLTEEKGYKQKTASRKINSINTLFYFLQDNKLIEVNPAEKLEHPDLENKPPRYLSPIEYKAIRDTARGNLRVYTMIELLLQTGARISEVSDLKIEDVKIDNSTPHIIIREKNNHRTRIINLNKTITKELKTYLEKRKSPPKDQGYLFTTRTGKKVLVRNMRTAINRIVKKAELKDVHINDLRNTFIIQQLKNGMNVERVAEIVGHKRVSSTQKYLKCIEASKRQPQTTKITAL